VQNLSRFGETEVPCDGVEDPQLAESGVFQLRKAELKALKI
jgi:hypothetical protein